jgi:aminomethyltransferase
MTDAPPHSPSSSPLRSPLHDRHVGLGAKFAGFAGWDMPLEYAGGGVIKEHTAVREAVGVFDVSHLGKADVRGPGAAEFVNACLTNDLERIAAGQAQYTMCGDDATGGVVDDLISYRTQPTRPRSFAGSRPRHRTASRSPTGTTTTRSSPYRDRARPTCWRLLVCRPTTPT